MKLTVVIPVFNNRDHIAECVGSVLAEPEPFMDMEVILVDDGSTDGSSNTCDIVAGRYFNVRVIHRSNGGLSAARNSGIDAATGDFITFVDCDDRITACTFTRNMESFAQDPSLDLIEYPISVHHGSKREYLVKFDGRKVSGNGIFRDWLVSGSNRHAYACNKIFRKDVLDGIRFPEGESFEDIAVCPEIIRRCRSILYSDTGLYLYCDNADGISAHYSFRTQEPLFRHNMDLLRIMSDMGLTETYTKQWLLCLNLLTDLYRCRDTDLRYARAAAARMSVLRPSFCNALRFRTGITGTLKFTAAAIFGTDAVCTVAGRNKLPS